MGKATMDDLEPIELMRIQVETLFVHDDRGRMLRTNEPDDRPAPRLFLGRTRHGHVVRFGASVSDTVARRLAAIVGQAPMTDDLRAPMPEIADLRAVLESDAAVEREWSGPAYRFPDALARPEGVVPISANENAAALRDSFHWVLDSACQPCFAVVLDGVAVSVCFTSRSGARAAEAGVDTLPEYRGHGYASAATEAWGAAVRESGRIPLYSTSWENLASQGVARRLGLVMYGTDAHWT